MTFNRHVRFYLHRVYDDGEGRVVPLAAPILRAAPRTFTATMNGANAEHAEDHHDNQETHAHHYDDCGRSRYDWEVQRTGQSSQYKIIYRINLQSLQRSTTGPQFDVWTGYELAYGGSENSSSDLLGSMC